VNNLLRKILPQPEFEPGTSCLSGVKVLINLIIEACTHIDYFDYKTIYFGITSNINDGNYLFI